MDRVTKCQVQAAVAQQFDKDAEVTAFNVVEFLEKGMNLTTAVYSINVTVKRNDSNEESTMIVKVHPKLNQPSADEFYVRTFEKEGGFYFDLLPLLSTELALIGQVNLRIPKPYYIHHGNNEETFYLEDLRAQGFVMSSVGSSFDVAHTILTLQEFARLHGSSMLLAKRSNKDSLLSKFPALKNFCEEEEVAKSMEKLFSGYMHGCADAAFKTSGYEAVGEIIKAKIPKLYADMVLQMNSTPQFEAVVQYDCFHNNYLFKYTASGCPIEVRIVDFQLSTVASAISDIITILHTCLTGATRRKHLDCFLHNYYATLGTIFASAGEPMPFTMDEMLEEYKRLKNYALIMGLFASSIIMEPQDIEDYDPSSSEEDAYEFQRRQILYSFDNNPTYKARFLDLFNEIMQADK